MELLKKLAATENIDIILTELDSYDFTTDLAGTVDGDNRRSTLRGGKAAEEESSIESTIPNNVTNEMLFKLVVTGLKQQSLIKDSIIGKMEEMLEKTNAELQITKKKVSNCEQKLITHESKLEAAELKINLQTKELATLQENLQRREKQDRRNKVIVSGPQIKFEDKTAPHQLADIARKAINNVYGHNIHPAAISECNRFNGNNKIIMSFVRSFDKDILMSSVVNKDKRDGVGVHVNEFLTPADSNLFFILRKLRQKNQNKFHSCYSRNGTVFVKMNGEVRAQPIKSDDDIEKLKSKFFLSNYSE